MVRGFLQRQKYRVLKQEHEGSSEYFKPEEARETIGFLFKVKYLEDAPLETKEYKYKTGAVYKGQWRGGLRHGAGTMKWSAKARYEGQWQYNMAEG